MNVKEATNWLNSLIHTLYDSRYGELQYYKQALSEIKELLVHLESKISDNDWIPCSKYLPSEDDYYIVTDDSGGMRMVTESKFTHDYEGNPVWLFANNVKAWKPMPEPYLGDHKLNINVAKHD